MMFLIDFSTRVRRLSRNIQKLASSIPEQNLLLNGMTTTRCFQSLLHRLRIHCNLTRSIR